MPCMPFLLDAYHLMCATCCVYAAQFSSFGHPKSGGTSVAAVLFRPIKKGEQLLMHYPLAHDGVCSACGCDIDMMSMKEFSAINISPQAHQALTNKANVNRVGKIPKRSINFLDHDKVCITCTCPYNLLAYHYWLAVAGLPVFAHLTLYSVLLNCAVRLVGLAISAVQLQIMPWLG